MTRVHTPTPATRTDSRATGAHPPLPAQPSMQDWLNRERVRPWWRKWGK